MTAVSLAVENDIFVELDPSGLPRVCGKFCLLGSLNTLPAGSLPLDASHPLSLALACVTSTRHTDNGAGTLAEVFHIVNLNALMISSCDMPFKQTTADTNKQGPNYQ